MYPAGVGQELCVYLACSRGGTETIPFVFCMQLPVNFDCVGVPTIPLSKKNKSQNETMHNTKIILSS